MLDHLRPYDLSRLSSAGESLPLETADVGSNPTAQTEHQDVKGSDWQPDESSHKSPPPKISVPSFLVKNQSG